MAFAQRSPMQMAGAATTWIKDRIAKIDLFDETKVEQQAESPWYQLGGMYYLAWVVVLISGVILVALYLPTTGQAYNSINMLSHTPLGSILRGMHKYAGDAMIIAATLRVYRMWFAAEYKNKGELTFILAILLLVIAMYSGLTGYLLIWNQRAFWATKVFATFPTYLDITPAYWAWPWDFENYNRSWLIPNAIGAVTKLVGNLTHQGFSTSQILMGGSSIGQATMTRFYSLHFAFSLILLVISEIYFYQNRLKRLNLKRGAVITLLAMILFVAIIFPAESGTRANPEVTPLPILSDWYFLALYQLLKYMDPYWATIWTLGIPFVTIGLTFLDWGPEKDPWKRPIFTTIGIMAAIEFIVFSVLIIANLANIETDPPYWYGHMILMITIGQFWHWGMYKQRLPMTVWVVFNLVTAGWYMLFWHHIVENPVLLNPQTNEYAFGGSSIMAWLSMMVSPENFQGTLIAAGLVDESGAPKAINWMNYYWSLLWLVYAVLQGLVAGYLFWLDRKERDERESLGQLEGAHPA